MTDSGNGAVNTQDELGASCATKNKKEKERKCPKKNKNKAQWLDMSKGQKSQLKGFPVTKAGIIRTKN